jgi:hypothetical protein
VERCSNNCLGCGHPLLCVEATNQINAWMNRGVVFTPHGSILKGRYDGYGGLDFFGVVVDGINTVWHEACWQAAGHPSGYQGPAQFSADQGWFFAEGAHDMAYPR